jgi:UrcA family protein
MRALHLSTVLILGLTSAGASPAALADRDVTRRAVVTYADLDLSRVEGATTLYRRVQRAARGVCKPEDPFFYVEGRRARGECYRLTVADAVARANNPLLTTLHRGETAAK